MNKGIHRILLGLALLLAPFAIGLMFLADHSPASVAFAPRLIILNVIEVLGIGVIVVLTHRRVTLISAIGIAVILAAGRALGNALAVATAMATIETSASSGFGSLFLTLWTGREDIAAMQILLQMMIGIPYFGLCFPRMVGEIASSAEATATSATPRISGDRHSVVSAVHQATGVAGTMAFDSYAEMDAVLSRTPHLLGYALADNDGLIVLTDGRRLPFPLTATVPRLQLGMQQYFEQQERGGVHPADLWQFSEEYTIVSCNVKPCFSLFLFFPPETRFGEVASRVRTLRASVHAFLSDRHRLLENEKKVA